MTLHLSHGHAHAELQGPLLCWLAVPVGLAWAALLCWRSARLAQQRLESDGSEIFARVRVPAS